MKTKNETLPIGTITNDGTVKSDGTVEPFKRASEVMTEAEFAEMKRKADVPISVMKVEDKPSLDEAKISLIKAKVAPNATNTEFELLMYMANKFDLDPLIKEIWLVKFGNSPAQIYAGRDGYLKIAHRSGQLDGMRSGVKKNEEGEVVGWCEIWRKDCSHSFYGEVLLSEYSTGQNLWKTKPMVMIQKVAESVLLRKAFSVSGMYSPEEIPERM
jgi:phage recombination protein Bet